MAINPAIRINNNYIGQGIGSDSGVWWWRGYMFEVAEEISVTALYGSWDSPNPERHRVGLYKVDGSNIPREVLRWEYLTHGRLVRYEINPVELEVGQRYLLAQGGQDRTNGMYRATYNYQDALDLDIITFWHPDNDMAVRWTSGGDENYILDKSYDDMGHSEDDNPDVGFEYEPVSRVNLYPKVGGSYKDTKSAWSKVNGVWREATNSFGKVAGTWKE